MIVPFMKKAMIAFMMMILPAGVVIGSDIRPQSQITAGDEVSMQYACFLENQELAATTLEKVAGDPGIKKSSIFVEPASFGPIMLKAGGEEEAEIDDDCEECKKKKKELQQFEKVIEAQLSKAVVGWQPGKTKKIKLSAPERTDVARTERFIQLAKVLKAPKELRVQREQYIGQNHEQPAVGQKVDYYPPLKGEVISIGEKEVVIRFSLSPDTAIDSPFGKKRAYDRGDFFEIVIDARVGALVRTGPLVGRIAEVGEKMFTLDYGQPFGGKILSCEVEAELPPASAKASLAKEE